MAHGVEQLGRPNAELWALAREGDRSAYAELVLRLAPRMRAALRATIARSRHWTRSRPDDVSDLLQELQVTLLSRGPSFVTFEDDGLQSSVEAAFCLVAMRVARSYLRSGRRSAWAEVPGDADVAALASAERTEEALVARDRLRRAFDGASGSRDQAIVHALYIEGRALEEICDSWKVTPNTVYCLARRFRARVKALEARDAQG